MLFRLTILTLLLIPLYHHGQDPLRFQDEILQFRSADAGEPSPPGALLFVGSSSIRMWDGLENAFEGFTAINRGFGGSHFSDALFWFEDLFPPHSPAAIFVYEGDNDVAGGKSPARILQDARHLVGRIQQTHPGVPIALISPKPSIDRWHMRATYLQVNKDLRALAEARDDLFYIDVWSPALNTEGRPRPETFLKDQLHMNEKGYKIWRREIRQALIRMTGASRGKS